MLERRRAHVLLLILTIVGVWACLIVTVARASGLAGAGDRYNVVLWIGLRLPRRWLNPAARRLGGGTRPATDAQLVDFFGQTAALAAAERDLDYAQATGRTDGVADRAVAAALLRLRALQFPVEARLSAELTAVARRERLETPLPIFDRARPLWPPVDFAYDLPPYLLILSRRDRIETVSTTLLRSDLSAAEIQRLEQVGERRGYSALVVRVGGVATYPSVVEEDDNYSGTLELISHEWTHQYLFFHPLGVRYFQSPELTAINETIASIVGQEFAARIRARYPLPAPPPVSHSSAPPPDPAIDFNRTMHQLRLEVDALLAQGKVAEAQQRMDDTQRFLAQHGYYIRRINQAYFAFYGTYADSPASSNPLGAQLVSLRGRYRTLGDFVRSVQDLTGPRELQQLLSEQR